MEVSSLSQLYVFFISVGAGAVCGVFFDIQRTIRKHFYAGKWRTAFEDILFTLFCIWVILAVGYIFDEGAIRYYLILGSISGALFYAAFLSSFFMKLSGKLLNLILKAVVLPTKKLLKAAAYPVRKILNFRKRFSAKRKKVLKNIFSKLGRRIKKLKKRIKML